MQLGLCLSDAGHPAGALGEEWRQRGPADEAVRARGRGGRGHGEAPARGLPTEGSEFALQEAVCRLVVLAPNWPGGWTADM